MSKDYSMDIGKAIDSASDKFLNVLYEGSIEKVNETQDGIQKKLRKKRNSNKAEIQNMIDGVEDFYNESMKFVTECLKDSLSSKNINIDVDQSSIQKTLQDIVKDYIKSVQDSLSKIKAPAYVKTKVDRKEDNRIKQYSPYVKYASYVQNTDNTIDTILENIRGAMISGDSGKKNELWKQLAAIMASKSIPLKDILKRYSENSQIAKSESEKKSISKLLENKQLSFENKSLNKLLGTTKTIGSFFDAISGIYSEFQDITRLDFSSLEKQEDIKAYLDNINRLIRYGFDLKITPEQKNAYRAAASNELRDSLRDETVNKERENLRSKVLEFSSYLSEVNEDINSVEQSNEVKNKYRLKSFDDYNGKYYISRQQDLKEAVESTNDALEHQQDIISGGGGGFSGGGGDGGGPPEDPLKKMIALLKEYYDLCIKIASPSISANVKKVYEGQHDAINQTIEALEKNFPGTKEKGLSDFGVKLQKAKYEDLVDNNQRNALKNVKTPLEEMISLYKEYYDLKIKVSSSNISDNVKGVYEGQIKQISAAIDAIESNNSGTKKQALSNMEVALRKAKYEDIVDSQKLKDLENAKKLYQDYLDAVSQLQLLNRENYFAYATKQDNTELQKKVDAQNQLVNSLRAELDTKKSILSLTDADIVKATSSRTLGKKSYAKYFDVEYQKQFDEYIKATNEYYDARYKLYNAEGKSADDATIQKYRKDAEDLAKAYEAAKSKYEAFVSFASSSAQYSVDVAAYQKKYEEQTQAGKNRYSQVFNKQLNDLVANSGDKIESYSKVIGTLRDKILQLQQIETKDNLNFDTDVQEVVSLNKEIQLLIKLLKSDAFNRTNKSGTIVGQFKGNNPLTSIESVKSLVQNYSDLGNSMKKIKNVSLGKDLKTATVEIITQDGNIKKLKLSYDDTTKSLRYLTLSEQHYATAGEKLKAAIKNKITQLGAYVSTAVLVREVFNMYRQGAQYVTELDTALTEFQLVTRKSNSAVSGMKAEVEDLANALATTNTEVTSSITNWSRLGYAASDSLDLAASSAKYAKVGFTDINTATTNLTSTIQAYKDSMYMGQDIGNFAEDIVDKYVNIGNNFAITSEGIGTALQKSASTLVAAGNSLDQAIALVTAGNSVLQDESMVGSGLKIVGMRLRGKRLCPPMKKFLGKHDNYIGSSLEIDLAEERLLS